MTQTRVVIQHTEMARVGSNTNITRIKGYIQLDKNTDTRMARATYLLLGSKMYSDIAGESKEGDKLYFNVIKNN